MNITYLREFVEVGLSLNLSKAAKTLHVSQPSLSKHIAALEQECRTPLLRRTSSRIQLTTAGQVLFEESFKLIRLHDEALERIRTLKEVPTLKIGGMFDNTDSITLINRALAQINADTATIAVSYQDYRHLPLFELLGKGKIDLGITILASTDELDDGLDCTFLFNDPMICLVKEGHPLAERETIHIAELGDQSILQPVGSYSSEYGRTTVRGIFERHHIKPVQRPVFVHSISELSTVANNDNVLIMERSMLTTQPFTNDYRVLSFFEDDVLFSFYAVYRKAADKPELAQFVRQLAKAGEAHRS